MYKGHPSISCVPGLDICQTLFMSNFVNITHRKTLVADNDLVIIESVPL